MRRAILLVCLAVVAGYGLTAVYKVEPKCANYSGWTDTLPGRRSVSEVLTLNVDELIYCEFFNGQGSAAGIDVNVYTYPGGSLVATGDTSDNGDHKWLRCYLSTSAPESLVKGKRLEFRWSRANGSRIQYYYNYCATRYDSMIVPGGDQPPPQPIRPALACRVYGRMNAVDSMDFGACEASWYVLDDSGHRLPLPNGDTLAARAKAANVSTVRLNIEWWDIQRDGPDSWDFGLFDSSMHSLQKTAGCRIVGLLVQPPDWACTRRDTNIWGDSVWRKSPPRCLDSAVTSDSNYLARFIEGLLAHCAESSFAIHDWEASNEVNYEDTSPTTGSFWQHPNRYYTGVGPGLHSMCSLYVRYAEVMASAIRSDPNHQDDRIAVNSVNWVNTDQAGGFSGKAWLREFYDVVDECGIPHFWDAISAHPYRETIPPLGMSWPFSPHEFETQAETLRRIMRQHGDHGELWNTEFSMPGLCWWVPDTSPYWQYTVSTPEQSGDYYCEMLATAEGMKAIPAGGFDRNYWWLLRQPPLWGWGCWALMDSALSHHAEYYAFKQTAERLTGKRFNGRVMTGDERDDQVRMYEFEDPATLKKTWVVWKNGGGEQDVSVQLPARADSAYIEMLDYNGTPPNSMRQANSYGWLGVGAGCRPQFIAEPASMPVRRPELRVDSFRVQPLPLHVNEPCLLQAFVWNSDSHAATPGSVQVSFRWNDSLLTTGVCEVVPETSGRWCTVLGCVVPAWTRGSGLLKADANPGEQYVEKASTDDNCSFIRTSSSWRPIGTLDVVMPPSHKTDAPLMVCRFTGISFERDSTGQTPPESIKLIQRRYSRADTLLDSAATGWFSFRPDTTWRFLLGSGRYRVRAVFKDGLDNLSQVVADLQDSVVVFDTVPPAGSVVIGQGTRFAPSPICTLHLAAQDSGSGVGWMRASNRVPVNMVRNGAFVATDGVWEFSGGEYDTAVNMAALTVSQTEAWARQLVPAESIQAHFCDSCVLEASILSRVRGQVSGDVSFWYWYTRNDTMADTSWMPVSSANYSGDFMSLTGHNNLQCRFQLAPPQPLQDFTWRGGVVKVRGQTGAPITGTVWTDNVTLGTFQMQPGPAWWTAFDTLAEWSMGGQAGERVVRALYQDSSGVENTAAGSDTVILDPTPPDVHVSFPQSQQYVNGVVDVSGWAFDPIDVPGDTWFVARRLFYCAAESSNWLLVKPDSVSYAPAYPNWNNPASPAVHLGYWNTESLPDGNYWLRLTASDSAGHLTTNQVWVVIDSAGDSSTSGGGASGGGSGAGGGSVYIGSATGNVLHLSDDLDTLGYFSVSDSGSPAYVTAILEVGNDSLLVLDARNKRIHKLHKNGQNRRRLVSNLTLPTGITRDGNGNFWLVDKGVNRIGKFRRDGTLVFVKGGLGQDSAKFNAPEAIAVRGALVYVADSKNDRVAVLDTSGNYLESIKGDFTSPQAVAVTDSGLILVTDTDAKRVKAITPTGGHVYTMKAEDGTKLTHLVLSENRHSIFTLKPSGNKVLKFRIQSDDTLPEGGQSAGGLNLPKVLALNQPFPNPARTRLHIAYALPRQTRVTLKLYDIAGKLVTTLANGEQKPGYYNLTWNRQDAKGRSCACGIYFCTMQAENQRFSRKVVLTD